MPIVHSASDDDIYEYMRVEKVRPCTKTKGGAEVSHDHEKYDRSHWLVSSSVSRGAQKAGGGVMGRDTGLCTRVAMPARLFTGFCG